MSLTHFRPVLVPASLEMCFSNPGMEQRTRQFRGCEWGQKESSMVGPGCDMNLPALWSSAFNGAGGEIYRKCNSY